MNLPIVVDVPDSTVAMLKAASPLVRAIADHAPALRELGGAARGFVREADRIIRAEQKKKRARPRR